MIIRVKLILLLIFLGHFYASPVCALAPTPQTEDPDIQKALLESWRSVKSEVPPIPSITLQLFLGDNKIGNILVPQSWDIARIQKEITTLCHTSGWLDVTEQLEFLEKGTSFKGGSLSFVNKTWTTEPYPDFSLHIQRKAVGNTYQLKLGDDALLRLA